MAVLQLRELCGYRAGDKGDIANVALFADDEVSHGFVFHPTSCVFGIASYGHAWPSLARSWSRCSWLRDRRRAPLHPRRSTQCCQRQRVNAVGPPGFPESKVLIVEANDVDVRGVRFIDALQRRLGAASCAGIQHRGRCAFGAGLPLPVCAMTLANTQRHIPELGRAGAAYGGVRSSCAMRFSIPHCSADRSSFAQL